MQHMMMIVPVNPDVKKLRHVAGRFWTLRQRRERVPFGTFSSSTMMVMMIAITPSLKASSRAVLIPKSSAMREQPHHPVAQGEVPMAFPCALARPARCCEPCHSHPFRAMIHRSISARMPKRQKDSPCEKNKFVDCRVHCIACLLSFVVLCAAIPTRAAEKSTAPQLIALAKSNSPTLRDAITTTFDPKDLTGRHRLDRPRSRLFLRHESSI